MIKKHLDMLGKREVTSEEPVMERPNFDFGLQAEGKQGAAERAGFKP